MEGGRYHQSRVRSPGGKACLRLYERRVAQNRAWDWDHPALGAEAFSPWDCPSQTGSPPSYREDTPPSYVANKYDVRGNMTHTHNTHTHYHGTSGLDILLASVATSALHDSAERIPLPVCHPETRRKYLDELKSWANSTNSGGSLLWLHGSAGMGKSVIAQAFAEECSKNKRTFASFFFKRGDPKRGNSSHLFTTLAYQLALSLPHLRAVIQQAVEMDPLVASRTPCVQAHKLVFEPLQFQTPELPIIIIIDGLDECGASQSQGRILRLLVDAMEKNTVHAHILITSRPGPHLREAFELGENLHSSRMELSADDAAYDDVHRFLRGAFSTIHDLSLQRGIDLGSRWPPPCVIRELAHRSGGAFIYASTVIHYIMDEFSHPATQLESVLKLDPESIAPLDDLYRTILSSLRSNQRLRQILYAICSDEWADPEDIDIIFSAPKGTTRLALRPLHSLLSVPPVAVPGGYHGYIIVLHSTFKDFLYDSLRSGDWCISTPSLKTDHVQMLLCVLSSESSSNNKRHGQLINWLCTHLRNMDGDGNLSEKFSNQSLQKHLFRYPFGPWPENATGYSRDVRNLFQELHVVSNLGQNMHITPSSSLLVPTLQFDSVYQSILAGSPQLCKVLNALRVWDDLGEVLRLYNLGYEIFQPFIAHRQVLALPFPNGDSPVDFIANQSRAGALCLDHKDIQEELWLSYFRGVNMFLQGQDFWVKWEQLSFFHPDHLSPAIATELQKLDISQVCSMAAADDQLHREFHEAALQMGGLENILIGLKDANVESRIIQCWENQKLRIFQCEEAHHLLPEDFNLLHKSDEGKLG
ncbi:hypothetical protein C8F01DRAFT_1126292 [Mycena amicta]|nr:hypothetical protein C8F01DRAFT_1126292 [Mycena amicta]